jgi:hypothetical protein
MGRVLLYHWSAWQKALEQVKNGIIANLHDRTRGNLLQIDSLAS